MNKIQDFGLQRMGNGWLVCVSKIQYETIIVARFSPLKMACMGQISSLDAHEAETAMMKCNERSTA